MTTGTATDLSASAVLLGTIQPRIDDLIGHHEFVRLLIEGELPAGALQTIGEQDPHFVAYERTALLLARTAPALPADLDRAYAGLAEMCDAEPLKVWHPLLKSVGVTPGEAPVHPVVSGYGGWLVDKARDPVTFAAGVISAEEHWRQIMRAVRAKAPEGSLQWELAGWWCTPWFTDLCDQARAGFDRLVSVTGPGSERTRHLITITGAENADHEQAFFDLCLHLRGAGR